MTMVLIDPVLIVQQHERIEKLSATCSWLLKHVSPEDREDIIALMETYRDVETHAEELLS